MTFVTFLWRQSCQTQLSLDGISSASPCRAVSIQRPRLPKIAAFLSLSPCVSVIYALIDINACMMHSCSYCRKQKVNHAVLKDSFFKRGKMTIVLSCIHKDFLVPRSGSAIRQWPKCHLRGNVKKQRFCQCYSPSSREQKRKHRYLHWAFIEAEKETVLWIGKDF